MENKNINELNISGRASYIKKIQTKNGGNITTFTISLYAGKDGDKAKYSYIKCSAFFDVDLKDKEQVVITGKLRGEIYTNKEGKEVSSPVIICDMINGVGETKTLFPQAKVIEHSNDNVSDSIPF